MRRNKLTLLLSLLISVFCQSCGSDSDQQPADKPPTSEAASAAESAGQAAADHDANPPSALDQAIHEASQQPAEQPTEQPSDEQPSDEQPSDEQPSDEQPSDEQPSDEQPSEPSATQPEDAAPQDPVKKAKLAYLSSLQEALKGAIQTANMQEVQRISGEIAKVTTDLKKPSSTPSPSPAIPLAGTSPDSDTSQPPQNNDSKNKPQNQKTLPQVTHEDYELENTPKGLVIKKYIGRSKKVVIPRQIEGFDVFEIGMRAFEGMGITDISFPETVKKIGAAAFSSNLFKELDLPASLEVIDQHSFAYCGNLKSVLIPKNVQFIKPESFIRCNSLERFVVHLSNPSFSTHDGVLYNKNQTELICFPRNSRQSRYIAPKTLERIKGYSITSEKLTRLSIPKDTIIEDQAFRGTKNISVIRR